MQTSFPAIRLFSFIGALLAWAAVLLQLYLIIINRTASIPETLMRFFTFFTILCNILVAVCCTTLAIRPLFNDGRFFSRSGVVSAVAVYITVVGTVYQFILRPLWEPQGLNRVADEMLHSVVPLFFVLYWFIFLPKQTLQWRNIFAWLIFPFCYLLVILFRGAVSGYYPYPFVNVTKLGYSSVFLNCLMMLAGFVAVSLLVVASGRISKREAAKVSD